jgi:3-oxoadipate CoA-transferase beta subunit
MTTTTLADGVVEHLDRGPLSRDEMAALVALDIPPGSYVNLGIGQPTLVADHLATESGVVLHTENGMLGMGPAATGDAVDWDLVNAGKQPVTELAGSSYFHHADSFAMMRGGHLDVAVLGAFQVSFGGDLANWHTGEDDAIPAVGGAMDLAVGARSVFVMMTLFDRAGRAKLVERCSYPLTGLACVDRIYTDLATIDITPAGPVVRATFGIDVRELADRLCLASAPASGPPQEKA